MPTKARREKGKESERIGLLILLHAQRNTKKEIEITARVVGKHIDACIRTGDPNAQRGREQDSTRLALAYWQVGRFHWKPSARPNNIIAILFHVPGMLFFPVTLQMGFSLRSA